MLRPLLASSLPTSGSVFAFRALVRLALSIPNIGQSKSHTTDASISIWALAPVSHQ